MIQPWNRITCDHCLRTPTWTTTLSGTMATEKWVRFFLRRDWYRLKTPEGELHFHALECARSLYPDAPLMAPTHQETYPPLGADGDIADN